MLEKWLLERFVDEARLLGDAFRCCEPAAPVPGLEWDARTVAAHTGAVHRWAADVVTRRLPTNERGGASAFWPTGANDARLAEWLDEGAALLLATLRSAPETLECFTFIPGVPPRLFWVRRQAHETAIHRADLEAAAGGSVTPVETSFAQDGLGEIVGAFATESGFATNSAGRLLLDASDGPAWMVTFGGDRTLVSSGDIAGAEADAVVCGTSDELYRWAWNRPSTATAAGDPDVLAAWRAVRVH